MNLNIQNSMLIWVIDRIQKKKLKNCLKKSYLGLYIGKIEIKSILPVRLSN